MQRPLLCGGESESRSCYESIVVPYGDTCEYSIQTRTCNNGSWDPDWPGCENLICVVCTLECDTNATCFYDDNDEIEFTCECNPGYQGDGFTCTFVVHTPIFARPNFSVGDGSC